jgi:hypothetical protein
MSAPTMELQQSTIREYARQLRLPALGSQFLRLAEEAVKQKRGHIAYLEALLSAELEERERHAVARRIAEAKFPKVKTLEDFHFDEAPIIAAAQIRKLAEGGYLSRSEPIIFLGDTGTGKTHLATGLAVEACRQRKRVRFTTAAELVNELIEAKNQSELSRVRKSRFDIRCGCLQTLRYVAGGAESSMEQSIPASKSRAPRLAANRRPEHAPCRRASSGSDEDHRPQDRLNGAKYSIVDADDLEIARKLMESRKNDEK